MELLRGWRGATLLATALVTWSCWSPLFNADISLAALSAAKMELTAKFDAGLNMPSNSTVLAVPSRESSPSAVVLFVVSPTQFSYQVYRNSGSGWAVSYTGNSTSFNTPLSDPELLSPQIGIPGSVAIAYSLPTQGNGSIVQIDETNFSTVSAYPTSGTSPSIYGLTSYPVSASQVQLHGLTSTSSLSDEAVVLTAPATQFSAATVTPTGGALDSYSYGWYAYNPDSTNPVTYLTHHELSGGRYTTERLDSYGNATWTRKDRVVAFLTSGELLTRDGSYYDVCDGDGNIKYSFPAGGLRFAYEYLNGSTAKCVFSQVYSTDSSGHSSTQKVAIYSIETNRLSTLKP